MPAVARLEELGPAAAAALWWPTTQHSHVAQAHVQVQQTGDTRGHTPRLCLDKHNAKVEPRAERLPEHPMCNTAGAWARPPGSA